MNKIVDKYNNMSLPLKAAIWFTMCQFIQKGIGMLTTPIFTRLLSTEEYGRASAFLSWADLIIPIITLSVWRGIMNLYAKDKDKDEVLSSVIGLSVIISIIWTVLVLSNSNVALSVTGLTFPLIICLLIYGFSQNIFYAWTVRMQYEYKYKPLVIVTLIYTTFSSAGGAFVVLLFSKTAEAKIVPQVVVLTIIVIVLMIVSFKHKKVFYNKRTWLFCIGFAMPLIPHYLSEVVLQSSDRIMINSLCTATDVAIYSIAYSAGSLINLVTSAINSAFAPFQYQKIKEAEYKSLAKTTTIVILFVAICLCGLMLFGREIVLIFGGQKYSDSVRLIIPICLGVFFNYVFQLFARVQEYFEQKHTIVIASVSCAILNIILNYIFIKICGYQAAAYTTFVCYFAFCFLHYLFYRKACMKNIGREIYDIKGLLLISAVLIILSPVLSILSRYYVIKYIMLAIVILLVFIFRKKIITFAKKLKDGK